MNSRIIIVLGLLLLALVLVRLYGGKSSEGFEGASKSVVICKADWCGHCKKAAPEFNKLISASPITLKDGSKAVVKILDADKDKSEVSQYKVKGFPTILVVDAGQVTEYPGDRTASGVIDFLNSNY
jgi:thioredoxin-like negative regulator of GroEL